MDVAKPSIADVFAEYLAERQQKLAKSTFQKYQGIIETFEGCLDGYAYQALDPAEEELWRSRWEVDEEAGSFCRTFGPDKILGEIGGFLDWYVIRKVLGPQWIAERAGPVMRDFVGWLVEKGYVPAEDAEDAIDIATDAGRNLPRADKLTSLLYDLTEAPVRGKAIEDLDIVGDMVSISKVEPGMLWFRGPDGEEIGPLKVPPAASKVASVGWEVSATHFLRTGKGWHLVEIGNVYPMG